jgi:hypothetical protein
MRESFQVPYLALNILKKESRVVSAFLVGVSLPKAFDFWCLSFLKEVGEVA